MAPGIFGGGNSGVKIFEINVEHDHLILKGERDSAPSASLRGNLFLKITEPINVKAVRMYLVGEAQVAVPVVTASSSRIVKEKREVYRHEWTFHPESRNNHTFPADSYNWPFSHVLPGTLPESVEGPSLCHVVYRMKATIDRGLFAKDLVARRHLRIIRTLDLSTQDAFVPGLMQNSWPNKFSYSISTASENIVFGTVAQATYTIIPLIKGFRVRRIDTKVIQYQNLEVRPRFEPPIHYPSSHVVGHDTLEPPEDAETEDLDGEEGFRFVRTVSLPRNLRQCTQSVDYREHPSAAFEITHKLKFWIRFTIGDSSESELRGVLGLRIFISPNYRISDANELLAPQGEGMLGPTSQLEEAAPPGYGDHQLDQIYSEVDPAAFVTPTASAPVTPFRRNSHSTGDIASMMAAHFSANALQSRLSEINSPFATHLRGQRAMAPLTPHYQDHPDTQDIFAAAAAAAAVAAGSSPPTRGNSRGRAVHFVSSGQQRVQLPPNRSLGDVAHHFEFNNEALSRVPSYDAALRDRIPSRPNTDLPDYETATSRPSSPTRRRRSSDLSSSVAPEPSPLESAGSSPVQIAMRRGSISSR